MVDLVIPVGMDDEHHGLGHVFSLSWLIRVTTWS
jgi:hypothetical protein